MDSNSIIIAHFIFTSITPATLSLSKWQTPMEGYTNSAWKIECTLTVFLSKSASHGDTLHIEWKDVKIKIGNKCLALPSDITFPLKDKIRLRNVLNGKAPNLFILVKQGATYYHINPASGKLIETATTC